MPRAKGAHLVLHGTYVRTCAGGRTARRQCSYNAAAFVMVYCVAWSVAVVKVNHRLRGALLACTVHKPIYLQTRPEVVGTQYRGIQ